MHLKIVLATIIFLFLFDLTHAQKRRRSHRRKSDTYIGVKVGANVATIGGDAEGLNPRISTFSGAYIGTEVSESFHLLGELVLSSQGAKIAGSDITLVYLYLNLPLVARGYTGKFFFEGGLQPGALLSARARNGNNSRGFGSDLRTFDFAVLGGIGYDFGKVDFNLRYNLGIISTSVVQEFSSMTFPNRVLQISLSSRF